MAVFADNRKAYFNYEIVETYEAGIELFGFEVKAVKAGTASLAGAYAIVRGGEVYLLNAHIPPYQKNNTDTGYDPERTRKLLLNKKEIKELADQNKKLTLVPLSMYSKGRRIKVELALARGKKLHDKRETIKKRDLDREQSREYTDR